MYPRIYEIFTFQFSSYSFDEENWLHQQLRMFKEAWNSVSCGLDVIQEVALYFKGVPLSKSFFYKTTQTFAERFHQIVWCHPEFHELE